MSSYMKPVMECVNFKLEERIASPCTGCCNETGWYDDWSSGGTKPVKKYLIAQTASTV